MSEFPSDEAPKQTVIREAFQGLKNCDLVYKDQCGLMKSKVTEAALKAVHEGAVVALLGTMKKGLNLLGIELPEEGIVYAGVVFGRSQKIGEDISALDLEEFARQHGVAFEKDNRG